MNKVSLMLPVLLVLMPIAVSAQSECHYDGKPLAQIGRLGSADEYECSQEMRFAFTTYVGQHPELSRNCVEVKATATRRFLYNNAASGGLGDVY